ncbi:MAG: OmpA family protein [Saprospiraceae bacterium]|nr:OmpA family protein [Saprospiraceae bacterium]
MTQKIYLLLVLCLGFSAVVSAQSKKKMDDKKASATTTAANGSLSLNNAKSKNMWELGLHGGYVFLQGDVKPQFPFPGFGIGAHIRKAVDYPFSWRVDVDYQQYKGFEVRPQGPGYVQDNRLLDPTTENYTKFSHYLTSPYYTNYKATSFAGTFQGIWSLNHMNYKNRLKKFNWYAVAGVGFDYLNSKMDLLGADGNAYNFPDYADVLASGGDNYIDYQKYIKEQAGVDGKYETSVNFFTPHGGVEDKFDRLFLFHVMAGTGISYKINSHFNIGLEHDAKIFFGNDADFIDNYRLKGGGVETQYRDVVNYTNIRLNFNLGSMKDRSEPLYWVGPFDSMLDDIAEVKSRPKLDLTDTDSDGIIDMLDQEKDSPKGAPVDTRGVALDSDGDGLQDYKDKEPYSPPGYKVDATGVAQVPKPEQLTKEDVLRIIRESGCCDKGSSNMSGWFLPTANFDSDSYCIKPSEVTKLQQVASAMQSNPALKVVVYGHTDKQSGDAYNNVLSYNRAVSAAEYLVSNFGVSRDRLVVEYGGENTTLIATNGSNAVNRRVEFRVATGSDSEMGRPTGPDAGRGCNGRKSSGKFGY